ncbi:fimbrial protein [Morganella morganii]|uniref:fimbrial protein n=1 Tax=Morganella morganii TaxID=582 RepID=UPI001E5F4FE6|nr:fimbrial protein [Morganella morganii]EKU5841383.1 type 1 fimbrial protein [Morganella morganii]UFH69300.1 type 1 fimbrial protein [Morganella morganii]WNP29838.1 fimbrial protein [Morganella morganii]
MYLMNIIKKCGMSLFPRVMVLFILLGIFTYSRAEVICDNCTLNNIEVEFKGIYKEGTCIISVNGGSSDGTVFLPTISYKTLSSAGNEAGATKFTVALDNCPKDVEAVLFFKSDSNLSPVNKNLKNSVGANFAKNVELRIRDDQSKHIGIDDPLSGQSYFISDVNSSVSKDYYVSYFAGDNAVSPGNVVAKSILEVIYK